MMTDGLLYSLMYIFVLTFICYPGLAITCTVNFLKDVNNYESWKFTFIQSLFNLNDMIGRYMGGITCLLLSNGTIRVSSLMRTLFIGTFLLISFDVPPSWLFSGDWFVILNVILFSLSNGYVSTLCAIKAPQTVEGESKGQVGGFIGITISTGIVIGSLLAFLMEFVINASPEGQN